MRTFSVDDQSRPQGVQRSALPDVIRRLSEIHRRLARCRVRCNNDNQRRLIEQAEDEVFRSLQLLEAEVDRSPASNG
jgi:hypothetical protein